MNDPEVALRREAIAKLSIFCDCEELANAKCADGGRGQIDVLCRPIDSALAKYSFAIEIKARKQITDGDLGPWIKQAADYVGALPDNGWPMVVATFVWFGAMEFDSKLIDRERIMGMLQLAQYFRVGRAQYVNGGLRLAFGPGADLYNERGRGWSTVAGRLLGAKRTRGGQRQRLKVREESN